MDNKPKPKILKSPVAKRRSRLVPKDQKVTLERVIGLTATSNALFACDPNTSTLAYPAGCVVVLYNQKKNKQGHIFNVSKKTITSLAFSGDGKHLITGESGHQPAVRVWDVAEKTQVAEFHGHKFGISCVAFSPNLKYIVSIGTQHDMQVNVWNWKTGSKVASNKVSSKVAAVAFSADGSYFVTAGMRHVKFWYLDSSKSKINATVPLNGRNGILGDHRNNFFCDVATGTGNLSNSTFCVTQSGFLCQFNEKRQMDKWVELRTTCANSISVAGSYIFVGCANGTTRVFSSTTLHFVATLPRPHYLGVDIAGVNNPSQINIKEGDIKYPDTVATRYDQEHNKVTCIYNDHSMYIWDVHDLKKIGKAWSFLYHSSCVYGVEMYPMLEPGLKSVLPSHSFFTCSSDDTIRIWNLDPHMAENDSYKSNIYSHELLKIMYMDPTLTSLCDRDYNPTGANDKTDVNYDDKNGIRSIRVSPDGQHLASGDRQGNVRIHELEKLMEIKQIEAHESEVLCLEYSNWINGPKLLASSSRDRLIHVFDTEQQYGLLQTLSDHSSSISAVKFTETDGHLKMISCGADKSILFRNLQMDPDFQFTLATHQVEKMTLYDMDVEPTQKFTAIACQDRNVRIYNIKTGKKKKEYKGSLSDDGTLLKMKLDPSGSYAATSSSDKNLCIIDFYTGELQATMFGHSEIATDVRFMNDLRHLISTAGDGCIFVWRLPQEMTCQMQNRLKDMGQNPPVHIMNGSMNGSIRLTPLKSFKKDVLDGTNLPVREFLSPERAMREMFPPLSSINPQLLQSPQTPSPKESAGFRFSISQLPSWAKKTFNETGAENDLGSSTTTSEDGGSGPAPRGRWAERADGQGPTIKTQDGKSVEVDSSADRRRFSYQAEIASSQLSDMRRETMILDRPTTTPTNMPVILDETNEDDDDDFLPVSSKTFVKQDPQEKTDVWDDLYNFDADDADQSDRTEIIYYPPSESDGSDTMASSYQVYNTGLSADKAARQLKHSLSMNSNPDADSETTDPVSLEDVDDDTDSVSSIPTTPMDEPKTQHREKFLKDMFENLSFTPDLPTDKFKEGLDTLEEEMATNHHAGNINHRQSLSARFLSKANARNAGPYGNIQRQDNWFDSVQRRKDDMARNLDESRKMLMAMGWKQESPETDGDEPFTEPKSAPTSPKLDSTLTPSRKDDLSSDNEDNELSNLAAHLRNQPEPPQMSSSNFSSKSKDQQTTPTSRRSPTSSARPRTLPLEKSGGKNTPTDKLTNKNPSRARKDTLTGQPTSNKLSEFKKKSNRLSTPNLSKVQIVSPELRRSSAGSNLNKSKSSSFGNLLDEEESELTSRGTNRRQRTKWSTPKMTSFASVPNLINPDDTGKLTLSVSNDNSFSDFRKQDINDNVINGVKAAGRKSPQVGHGIDPSMKNTRRAASTSRLSAGSGKTEVVDDKKPLNRKQAASTANLKSSETSKGTDRDLMPPPAFTNVAKTKPETRFMKRAQQPRRKTTGTTELTFEEAKNILKGNSGILKGKAEGEKRSASQSPTANRSSSQNTVEIDVENNELGPITDPALLNAATEIELTAAEIRRKSTSGSSASVGLEASPQDLPERDIPPERDSSRTISVTTKPRNVVNVKPQSVKAMVKEATYNDSKDTPSDSGLSAQDEDNCPSPSVKDRIAKLNKHVSESSRPHSPSRIVRAESPAPDSPRQTSSIKFNFSSSSQKATLSSAMPTPILSMANNANTSTTPKTPPRNSISNSAESFPAVSEPLRDQKSHTQTVLGTSNLIGGLPPVFTQSLSPPMQMTTSMDSERISPHFSPGNHSNHSPRSVADTGLGSDTDLESSQTFRKDQLLAQADPQKLILESLDQIQVIVDRMSHVYQQVQRDQPGRASDIRKQVHERFPALIKSLSETFGIALPSNHDDSMTTVPRDALTDLIQRANDLNKYIGSSHGMNS